MINPQHLDPSPNSQGRLKMHILSGTTFLVLEQYRKMQLTLKMCILVFFEKKAFRFFIKLQLLVPFVP